MVEKFKQFLDQVYTQGRTFYSGLTKNRKIALLGGFLLIVFIMTMGLLYKPTIPYEVAYTNLSAEDKIAILANLKKANVHDFKMDGDTLSFPEDKILDIKMSLAQEGLPSSGSGSGWEKFDERSFGMSDFDQKIVKLRALQGELARTINKLEPVANSRVHIVIPDNAIFASERKPPTASIYLKLRLGKTLTQRQVQGIIHLIAHAVEGLDSKDVTIVDQEGNMLTQIEQDDGGFDKVTNTQRDYQRKVEKELEQKIKDILIRVVGTDKVVTRVQALLDFKKVEQTISDVDPERSAVIASQRNEQSTQGSGLNPTGVPGAKSNLPGEREDNGASGGLSNSTKSNSENLNFEVKKMISKIVEPIGSTQKLSASVLVDGKMVDGKFEPRSKEEIEKITNLVKNAIGFVDNRDSITVEQTQFEPDSDAIAEKESITARQFSLIQTIVVAVVGIGVMFFIYFGLVRPYFRWLTFDPEKRSKEQLGLVEYEFEKTGASAKRVQLQEDIPFDKLSPKEQILYLAKNDPKKTTEAIRQLLSPHS